MVLRHDIGGDALSNGSRELLEGAQDGDQLPEQRDERIPQPMAPFSTVFRRFQHIGDLSWRKGVVNISKSQ